MKIHVGWWRASATVSAVIEEFDLPCAECGHELERTTADDLGTDDVTVADCPNCGSRYYPRGALERL
jgi:DNA-directed RNA polymerase subunit RPC12/RpoP